MVGEAGIVVLDLDMLFGSAVRNRKRWVLEAVISERFFGMVGEMGCV